MARRCGLRFMLRAGLNENHKYAIEESFFRRPQGYIGSSMIDRMTPWRNRLHLMQLLRI